MTTQTKRRRARALVNTTVTTKVEGKAMPVDFLWTGGLDSTYRLLELVLLKRCHVQPWYLVDEERASTPFELEAMQKILKEIEALDSEAVDLIAPMRIVSVDEVAPDPEISAMCGRLRLGSQYDWLARFAAQHGLDHLELCVEKRDSRVCGMLDGDMLHVKSRGGMTYQLASEPSDPDFELFRSFEFPILHLTKADLLQRAESNGWGEIMKLTWFCHTPRNEQPCGMCTPCMIVLQEGLGERIPRLRRLRPRLRLLKQALS